MMMVSGTALRRTVPHRTKASKHYTWYQMYIKYTLIIYCIYIRNIHMYAYLVNTVGNFGHAYTSSSLFTLGSIHAELPGVVEGKVSVPLSRRGHAT